MKRFLGVILGVLIVGVGLAWLAYPLLAEVKAPIRVGLLHSKTGSMAVNEQSMIDAEMLAVEEINASGGLLGRKVQWVFADGRSSPEIFAREAERLIESEKVSVLFGTYSSASRKAVKTVVERADHLLIYPVAYEGLEESSNIIYTGAAPNQQIIPTVKWCRDLLKAKTFYLVGNDDLWPHAVNTIIKDQLKALGATLAGEEYVDLGATDLDGLVQKAQAAKPDVILSTLVGDSNLPFYKAIRGGKVDTSNTAILSFIVAEDELRGLPAWQMINDYSVCNYFQAIDRPENQAFVQKYQARFGADRTVSDTIDTAYNSVRFWAQAVREAGTAELSEVRPALLRQSLNAPEGVISIDRETQHTWRPFFVGRIKKDRQIDIIASFTKPIRPRPFPFSRTRDEWMTYLERLYAGWGGNWSPPSTGKIGLQ